MMKRLTLITICLLAFTGLFAQELANFAGRQPVISPDIKGNEITFRVSAPYADEVRLSGSWQADMRSAIEMKKDEAGLWSVTIPAPAPELYTYSFIVDGLSVTDANNVLMQRDGTRYLSVLLIPGEVTANYFEAKNRGNLSQVWYDSPTLGLNRRMFIYTPYGYETSKTKYPVLYLLHGAGGDEDAWSTMGRTCQIMDNLIEKKLAKPMLVVMPNGNPGQQAARTQLIPEKPFDRNNPGTPNAYVHSIVKDIVPYIEKNYKVIAKPASRAIAGLSMGGGHTISCTNLYPGFFQYICPLSMGIRVTDENKATYDADFRAVKKAGYKLYWIACGDSDFLIEQARTLDATLTRLGMKHTFFVNSGGHTWTNWRIYLNNFAPLLFK
ncbi:MAG: esterase [Bacteroidales bacterium]|nr:esterase [Bacteroidales bacterium]MBP7038283.1 esterase [Bacteroidales bacterium]MDI9552992.1 alpha/beta hydrolase-fold protein [Bacteroidota bacterium]